MASGDPSAVAGDVARLLEALAAVSQAFESGDAAASSNAAVAAVTDIIEAAYADAGSDTAAAMASEQLLREVHAFLSCPSSNQMAIEALSLELPKPVAKLGARMGNCWDIARTIIEFFVSNCNPRDMLSILCEAVDTPVGLHGSAYFVLLLDGLARVLILIQRRHIEQVKVILPAVLRVMHATVSECDEEDGRSTVDLFNAALRIGNAIQDMCKTMVNHKKEELCSILGLYALQNIALVSESKHQHILSACGSVVLQHSKFLTFCGFTYLGLLTGNDVTSAANKLSKDEDADFMNCFSFAKDGASLAVVWTYMHDDMSKYAGAELDSALKEVQDNYRRKWEAINMFRYVLSSINYPWVIKSHSIDLLVTLVDENCVEETSDHVDFSSSTQIFATLKAIESVMIAAPDGLMRKKAFAALKKVISLVPCSQRFDILEALIKNSMFPSLTAIILDLVKNEVLRESRQADQDCIESDRSQGGGQTTRWASHALELVELVLRPPQGGPPCLPDCSEQSPNGVREAKAWKKEVFLSPLWSHFTCALCLHSFFRLLIFFCVSPNVFVFQSFRSIAIVCNPLISSLPYLRLETFQAFVTMASHSSSSNQFASNLKVLSALNLLRLILLIDSRGSRPRKMFREETIRKVYAEWLIPLRPIVAGIQSEIGKDDSEDANQMMCLLNPVQLVLHRCIELVEDKMKSS